MAYVRPIVVIGSLNMDLVARCDHLPRPGQTVFGSGFFTSPGGKGANQAVAAARLGASVTMAGCVGDDPFGRTLLNGLRADGVACESVQQVTRPTGTALITVDDQGANTIVVISGANMACDAALVDRALAAVDNPGVLLLQHEIPEAANMHAIRAARAAGWFVVLNPAPAHAIRTGVAAIDRFDRAERDRGGGAGRQQRSSGRSATPADAGGAGGSGDAGRRRDIVMQQRRRVALSSGCCAAG